MGATSSTLDSAEKKMQEQEVVGKHSKLTYIVPSKKKGNFNQISHANAAAAATREAVAAAVAAVEAAAIKEFKEKKPAAPQARGGRRVVKIGASGGGKRTQKNKKKVKFSRKTNSVRKL